MPERVFLITGSSRGIGRSLAENYLQRGEYVIGISRGDKTIDHQNYSHHSGDVTDSAHIRKILQKIRNHTNHVDVLINNAGAARMLPVALTPHETARQVMDVNFQSTFIVSNEAIRLLRRSKAARIINLTSVAVPLRLEGEAVYASAKAAVEMLTRVTAKELGPFGITCNAIGPSPIKTDLIKNVADDKIEALIKQQAIADWAEAKDVTNVVDFFIKPESRLITGQVIYLAGFG